MDKNLGALIIAGTMLINGGQDALAANNPVKLGQSKVGDTTETVKRDVQDCIRGQIQLPNGGCAIMVNLISQVSPINPAKKTSGHIKEEISKHEKEGKETQREELANFWVGVGGVGLLGGLLGGLLISFPKISKKKCKEPKIIE